MSKQSASFSVISPRHEAALEICDTLQCLGLDDSYGIDLQRATDRKGKQHWSITFCRARTLDGVVHVYSPYFIQIKYAQGGRKVSEIFRSTYDAKAFLVNRFVQP